LAPFCWRRHACLGVSWFGPSRSGRPARNHVRGTLELFAVRTALDFIATLGEKRLRTKSRVEWLTPFTG
jgi:hypothetical protein